MSSRSAAVQHLERLAHLERVARRQPQRGLHVGEQRDRRDAVVAAEGDHRLGELPGARDVLHERAGADLDVQHERAGALGDLLAHDRARDERDRLDGAGDVAQGVELLVGRGQVVARRADHRADVAQLRHELRTGDAWLASPGWTRACRGCRPCGRARGRTAAGTAAPQAATSGESGSVILSPTPPVECLSVVGRPTEDVGRQLHADAGGDHRLGPPRDLAARHAVEQDRHGQRRHLLVGDVAARVGRDDPVDLAVAEHATVALGGDDVDGIEGSVHAAAPLDRSRSSGPNASGSTSLIGRTPRTVSSSRSGAAVLPQQLPAAPARHQRVTVPVDADDGHQPAATGRVQRRDQAALGAQADAVRRVLDVAARPRCGRRRPARRHPPGSASTERRHAA